jgi:hypothetical protein
MGTVRGMARTASDGRIAAVNAMISHVAHGRGHSSRIVAGSAHGLLRSTVRVEVAPAQGVTVIATNLVAFVVRGHQSDSRAGYQYNDR